MRRNLNKTGPLKNDVGDGFSNVRYFLKKVGYRLKNIGYYFYNMPCCFYALRIP